MDSNVMAVVDRRIEWRSKCDCWMVLTLLLALLPMMLPLARRVAQILYDILLNIAIGLGNVSLLLVGV